MFLQSPAWIPLPQCSVPLIGVPLSCVVPKRVEWNITIHWKRSGNWPSALRIKKAEGGHTCPDGPDGHPKEPRECYPDSDLVTMRSKIVYKKAPHNAELLSNLGVPSLGANLVLTVISLYDFLEMGLEIADWISKTSGNARHVPYVELPNGVDDFLKDAKFGFNV